MNIIVNSKLHSFYSNLAKSTLASYCSNVVKVLELLKTKNIEYLYTNPNEVIKIIKENYDEIGTHKSKYISIIAYIKTMAIVNEDENEDENEDDNEDKNEINIKINKAKKIYNDEIDIIKLETKKKLSTFTKSKKEEASWINEDEIKIIDKYLLDKVPIEINNLQDLKNFRNLIIFRFYNIVASRCELALSKLYYNDEIEDLDSLSKENNYIIINKANKKITYILNQHKNKNKKGSRSVAISNKKFYDLLVKYKKAVESFDNNKYLLLNSNGKGNISYTRLSQVYASFGNIIKKKISIRVNRKMDSSNNIDIKKIINVSERQGHSIFESIFTYSKLK